jgi:hypothetical protein
MEPITREEYYLAKIAGTYEGKTPKPVTNDEYYLATMAGDYSGNTPQPVTRLQYYMAKVAGVWGGSIPAPVTRLEYYWAAIASGEGKVFPPVTREEHFLVLVADAYSVVLTVVTGNHALLENSKGNRGLESLTLYGKSTQGSTPSPSYPQEIESAGQDGEIEVEVLSGNLFDKSAAYDLTQSGGWSASFDGEELKVVGNNITIGSIRLFNYKKTLPAGTYTFSISKPLPFEIRIDNYFLIKKGDTSATVTFDNGVSMSHFAVDAEPGATFNEQRFKIMLNAGSTALPYELYKPAQTLIIPTPNGLPGVPTIDNGNYTDASGQQWLCDEVDLKRGVYVQNVAFAEFGKGITSLTKNSGVSSKNIVSAYFFSIPRKRAKTRHTIMSNCLRFVANVSSSNPAYVISNESQTEAMYVSIPAELYENDDQMLNLLAEKKVKILYATYPTERPLSTEELEKYRSLRTYSPTTTVINDAGAGMSVGYAKMK